MCARRPHIIQLNNIGYINLRIILIGLFKLLGGLIINIHHVSIFCFLNIRMMKRP